MRPKQRYYHRHDGERRRDGDMRDERAARHLAILLERRRKSRDGRRDERRQTRHVHRDTQPANQPGLPTTVSHRHAAPANQTQHHVDHDYGERNEEDRGHRRRVRHRVLPTVAADNRSMARTA